MAMPHSARRCSNRSPIEQHCAVNFGLFARSCKKSAILEHLRAVIKVTFIGAGSVEFTRNVATDLCGYPEFRGGLHFALYAISAERLAHAELLVRRISEQTGA